MAPSPPSGPRRKPGGWGRAPRTRGAGVRGIANAGCVGGGAGSGGDRGGARLLRGALGAAGDDAGEELLRRGAAVRRVGSELRVQLRAQGGASET